MGAGVAGVSVLAWLVVLSLYDIRERRLPNWLTVPGALAILAVAAVAGRGVPALVGAIGLAGLYLVIHLISPASMGAGDVKARGGRRGTDGRVRIRRVGGGRDRGAIADRGVAVALVSLARRAETAVPHGPSMCLATMAAAMLAIL